MNLRELAKEIISRLHLSTWVSRRVLSKEHAVLHGTFKPKSKIKSILLYTTVKCASSVTHKVLFELARKKDADYSHINLFRYYYNFNKDPDVAFSKDVDTALLPQGIVYAPLRRAFFPNNHDKYSVLIILRDPRDVLVSAYFSIRKSHVLPMNPHIREGLLSERRKAQEETIDEYALRCAPQFIEYYKNYVAFSLQNDILFLTYEEFVNNYDSFIDKIIDYLEIEKTKVDRDRLLNIAGTNKRVTEDPTQHIRKKSPGDYAEKLKPETITQLNQDFKFYFEFLKRNET